MALTSDSMRGAARRKAQRAREKVREAETQLEAANGALKEAIPLRDVEAIAEAAERTARAEEEVHEAAHELEIVDALLQDGAAAVPPPGKSGEGARSLLPFLGQR